MTPSYFLPLYHRPLRCHHRWGLVACPLQARSMAGADLSSRCLTAQSNPALGSLYQLPCHQHGSLTLVRFTPKLPVAYRNWTLQTLYSTGSECQTYLYSSLHEIHKGCWCSTVEMSHHRNWSLYSQSGSFQARGLAYHCSFTPLPPHWLGCFASASQPASQCWMLACLASRRCPTS